MVLLDVREARELEEEPGSLPGIVHIPIGSLSARLGELDSFRDREIVTLCRMGGRAHTAAQILLAAGFADVAVLEGGMTGLRKVGGPARRSG
jgi:rhodanese-related sulfurtransferase